MVYDNEDCRIALVRQRAGRIRAPHLVGSLRYDRPVVGLRAVTVARPDRRKQLVLAHESKNSIPASRHTLEAQSGMDLSVPFPGPRRVLDDAPDLDQKLLIGEQRLWTALGRRAFVDPALTSHAGSLVEG